MPSYDEHLERQRSKAMDFCTVCGKEHDEDEECWPDRDWMQEAKDRRESA